MKQSGFLPLARVGSSLSLFCILLCIHINFTLAHFLPSGSEGVMDTVKIFFFAGSALGALLCPLFLPVPDGINKPLNFSIGFIVFLVALEFILRSMGFDVWLNSWTVRGIMAIPDGMLTTMGYGLFYLTWLQKRAAAGYRVNRTGRFCSLVLSIALLCSVLARYYSIPFLEAGIAAKDPLKGAEFSFNFIKWCIMVLGITAAASVFFLRYAVYASVTAPSDPPAGKTNWFVMLRLIGLVSVFTLLNGVLNMWTLPLYSDNAVFHPHYLTVAVAVAILTFFAGRSITSFIRRFMPPAIVLFILLSCAPLFKEYSQFNMIMSTLIAIAHYTTWVVFTTAVVELYVGGFLFYGAVSVIYFSVAFAFLAPVIGPLVPDGIEYSVLSIVIAAVLFMLLAFRLIFPKQPRSAAGQEQLPKMSDDEVSNMENIFKERCLSQREIEVAHLLVKEGLGKQEIGERLFITPGTAKIHISNIYQKFDVDNRAEFMSLFVKGAEI
jgi:DNA-binding CsgD family transcriptional regulator